MLDRLMALFLDKTKPGEVRIKAGKIILERGYGKVSWLVKPLDPPGATTGPAFQMTSSA